MKPDVMNQSPLVNATLTIRIDSYWHAGTGRGRSFEIDSVVHRDNLGLPALPGRSVKGLLRDAIAGAEALGWYAELPGKEAGTSTVEHQLFGPRGDGVITYPGWLFVSDARLPRDLLAEFARDVELSQKDREPLRRRLFSNLFSTAISLDTGSSTSKSLRGTEVAVPMTLTADLTINPTANPHPPVSMTPAEAAASARTALENIKLALPLIRGVGSARHRGMGRAVFTIVEQTT